MNTLAPHRICPGRFFAKDGLFLVFTSILSVYDLLPAVNDAGDPVPVNADSPGDGILLYARSPFSHYDEPLNLRADIRSR